MRLLMPYYNIQLTESNPIQDPNAENVAFSSSSYWNTNAEAVNMRNSKNYIQKYIAAYQKTLHSYGATLARTMIFRKNHLNTVLQSYRNPSRCWFLLGWFGWCSYSWDRRFYVECYLFKFFAVELDHWW